MGGMLTARYVPADWFLWREDSANRCTLLIGNSPAHSIITYCDCCHPLPPFVQNWISRIVSNAQ